jgi:hypothetical protein
MAEEGKNGRRGKQVEENYSQNKTYLPILKID